MLYITSFFLLIRNIAFAKITFTKLTFIVYRHSFRPITFRSRSISINFRAKDKKLYPNFIARKFQQTRQASHQIIIRFT